MFFFFKRSTIHLDCFTDRAYVYETSPIVKGSECLPNWWKKLKKPEFDFGEMKSHLNMKTCAGFIDFYTNSVCIRLWSDLAIKLSPGKILHYMFSDAKSSLVSHPPMQYEGYLSDAYQHIKLISPWHFNCKEDINWICVGNQWNEKYTNEMLITSGILNFKRQRTTNIQAFLKYDKHHIDKIYEFGTPLMNIFPMSEKKIKIHNHLVKTEDLPFVIKNYPTDHMTFLKKYYNYSKIRTEKKSKCPFHF